MFKAFNLQGFDKGFIPPQYQEGLIKYGKSVTADGRAAVTKALKTIATNDAVLDGQKIQDSWFPDVEADVMLSHSHRDEDEVLMLAGWLFDCFGIKAFVDSAIWGYAGDLLKTIDDEYCYQSDSKTYIYERRNESTSHVHMLLTTALGMMIHKTECLIFVNTPSSIAVQEVVTAKTFSPWIYAELTMAGIVQEIMPDRLMKEERSIKASAAKGMSNQASKELQILHTVRDMSRLHLIKRNTLETWKKECTIKGPASLDTLYEVAVR